MEILSWASAIQHDFPDLYSTATPPNSGRPLIYIAGIPVIEYRNREHPCTDWTYHDHVKR
jgi:hypothetical protein